MPLFSWISVCVLTVLIIFPSVRQLLRSLFFPTSKSPQDDDGVQDQDKAEIDGGTWERLSVFEHVEQGLLQNPDGPAVVCPFQSADALDNILVSSTTDKGEKREREAEGDKPLTITYTQLHLTALRLACALFARGVQAGGSTRLVMLIPNGGEYAVLLWACLLLRVTYVSLDPALLDVDVSNLTTLKQLLRPLRPQIVVVPDPERGRVVDVAMAELRLPQPVRVCLCCQLSREHGQDRPFPFPPPQPPGGAGKNGTWHSLASLVNNQSGTSVSDEDEQTTTTALVRAARQDHPDRIHSIMFTSGTSGSLPKGCPMRAGGMAHVLHSQRWLLGRADTEDDEDNDNKNHKTKSRPPIALMQPHNSRGIAPAQTLQTWKAGGAVVLTGQTFSVAGVVDAVRRARVSFVVLTPAMVHEMASSYLGLPGTVTAVGLDLGSVRRVQLGGDAITRGVLRRCTVLFPRAQVVVNHGMTEGGGAFVWPFLTSSSSSSHSTSSATASSVPLDGAQDGDGVQDGIRYFGEMCPVGTVAPGSRVKIWDAQRRRVVRRGELGELHISSPSLIRGYLGGREWEAFYRDDGRDGRWWFKTGDVAMADRDGLVFILGRKKDVMERGGVLVVPAAIESSIEAFTGAQTVVVATPHPVLGSEPFAVLHSLQRKTEASIRAHVKKTLGENYALGGLVTLEQLELVEFPLNATHKVVKSEVQAAVLRYLERGHTEKNGYEKL
ncbi:uncharacterized protein C8A04DRAFT_31362 [Dichotomopilus funicola]|uniref:AMP-dependent synthetase/ligase domain-containing protein n=1 Tax=Dichotomopilus funicola TaxID=1934379 RepID=A0AAN6UXQ1_9PEZI|nr:hypothetical protein C8A04DRAFT_31362 [Dichotomopilus funicola]